MPQSIELGSGPAEEEVAAIGQPDYPERSRQEIKAYQDQFQRLHPIPPELNEACWYRSKEHHHEWGTYRELELCYRNHPNAMEFAIAAEDKIPSHWDEKARLALKIN